MITSTNYHLHTINHEYVAVDFLRELSYQLLSLVSRARSVLLDISYG